jgi:hypothetical protein
MNTYVKFIEKLAFNQLKAASCAAVRRGMQ